MPKKPKPKQRSPVERVVQAFQGHKKRLAELHEQGRITKTEHDKVLKSMGDTVREAGYEMQKGSKAQRIKIADGVEKMINEQKTFNAHAELRKELTKKSTERANLRRRAGRYGDY